jgi:hypothetical protein
MMSTASIGHTRRPVKCGLRQRRGYASAIAKMSCAASNAWVIPCWLPPSAPPLGRSARPDTLAHPGRLGDAYVDCESGDRLSAAALGRQERLKIRCRDRARESERPSRPWGGALPVREDGGACGAGQDHGDGALLGGAPSLAAARHGVGEDAWVAAHQRMHGLVLGGGGVNAPGSPPQQRCSPRQMVTSLAQAIPLNDPRADSRRCAGHNPAGGG